MALCEACFAEVAREDRREVDGGIYHAECVPDDAAIKALAEAIGESRERQQVDGPRVWPDDPGAGGGG